MSNNQVATIHHGRSSHGELYSHQQRQQQRFHTRTNMNDPLSWYWWIKGRFFSDVPHDFMPSTLSSSSSSSSSVGSDFNDTLENIAWSSIKYDHLGGPNTEHVLLTLLSPPSSSSSSWWRRKSDKSATTTDIVVRNPNRAWDMSLGASRIMKRVFHFENSLHLITVLMHVLVLLPLTSTFIQTSQLRGNQSGIVQYLLQKLWIMSQSPSGRMKRSSK